MSKESIKHLTQSTTVHKPAVSNNKLCLGMTQAEALKLGHKTASIFKTYDLNNDGVIQENEFDDYVKKTVDTNVENAIGNHNNKTDEKQASKDVKTELKLRYGFMEEEIKKNGKIDLNKYAKEELGIDLSKYKTDEEKQKAISDAMSKRYVVDKKDPNSLYNKALARLKSGTYTNFERNLIGNKKLSQAELEKYAEMSLKRKEIYDAANLMYNINNDDDKQLFLSTLAGRNDNVKGALTGLMVENIKEPDKRAEFLKQMDAAGFHIDYTQSEMSGHAAKNNNIIIAQNADFNTASHLIIDSMKMDKKTQEESFEVVGDVQKDKLNKGKISKKEYNNNYVSLANQAYKIKLASKAYKYVQAHSTDENRTDAMKALASHAYEIQDSNERGQAINGLTSSKYYNDDVKNSLNQSYNEYTNSNTSNTGSGALASSKVFVPTPKQEETPRSSISEDNDEHYERMSDHQLEQTTSHKIDLMNKENKKSMNNTKAADTAQRPHFTSVKMALDYCFTKKNLPDKIKAKIISKLQSANPVALRNLFLTCNNSVKEILLKNNLVSPTWVAEKLSDSELNEMPGYIHQRITEVKKDMLKHNATNPISQNHSKGIQQFRDLATA